MVPRRLAALLVMGVAVIASPPARAHQSSIAYSEVVLDGADVLFSIQMANTDLFEAVGVERDRPVTRDEVLGQRDRLFRWLMAHLRVDERGDPCPAEPRDLQLVDKLDGFFAAAQLRFRCPRPVEEGRLVYDLFFDLDPRHQGVAHVREAGDDPDEDPGREQILREGQRTLPLRRSPSAWDHARQFLHLGIEHIFTGYDHIAFVFALLVLAGAGGLRAGAARVLGVVTAFTVAHSITLIASAAGADPRMPLRVVPAVASVLAVQILVEDRRAAAGRPSSPAARAARLALGALLALALAEAALRFAPGLAVDPSRLVEAAIALSIVYVAVENLVVAEPEHRFLLTFGFGLIHGFGFASVLREIGLPERGLLLSLVSFNVGVELGQLAVVAAVLPLLALVAQPSPRRPVTVEVAAVAAVAALTFALFRRFDVPALPLGLVVFGGAPLLYALGRRFGYRAVVRLGGSAVVAALATLWFFERVRGVVWLGGRLG